MSCRFEYPVILPLVIVRFSPFIFKSPPFFVQFFSCSSTFLLPKFCMSFIGAGNPYSLILSPM